MAGSRLSISPKDVEMILNQEKSLILELLDTARSKQRAILQDRLDQLVGFTREEERIRAELEALESVRAGMFPVPADSDEDTSLAEYALGAGEPWNVRLLRLREELILATKELRSVCELNMRLLRDSISLAQLSIELVSGRSADATYIPSGVRSARSGSAGLALLDKLA